MSAVTDRPCSRWGENRVVAADGQDINTAL